MRMPLLCLLPILLLTGCKEDFMTLHFQAPVGRTGNSPVIQQGYEMALRKAIHARGIDLETIALAMDETDDKTIHLSLARSLDDQQRATLRELFEEIPRARAATTWQVEMRLLPDDKRAPGSGINRDDLGDTSQPITLTLQVDPRVRTYSTTSLQEQLRSTTEDRERQSDVSCALFAKVVKSKLPFMIKRIQPLPDAPPEEALVTFSSSDSMFDQVVARFEFRDAELKQQIQAGKVSPWQTGYYLQPDPLHSFSLSMQVGYLGEQSLNFNSGTDQRMSSLVVACDKLLDTLGRPFSLEAGVGIDRIQRVTFVGKAPHA